MEPTLEKSQQLADTIESIKMILFMVDVEYAKSAVKSFQEHANRMDSMAVLSSRYNPKKSDLILLQAKMLNHLIHFIEMGKEVDNLKKYVANEAAIRDHIDSFFI